MASYMNTFHISASAKKVPFFLRSYILCKRSPSLAYSITIQSDFEVSSKKAARYPIIFLCRIEARKRTSLRAFSLSFSLSFAMLTYFKAYSRPSCLRMAKLTYEYEPSPNFFLILKSDNLGVAATMFSIYSYIIKH
jgi:hypothetical protein